MNEELDVTALAAQRVAELKALGQTAAHDAEKFWLELERVLLASDFVYETLLRHQAILQDADWIADIWQPGSLEQFKTEFQAYLNDQDAWAQESRLMAVLRHYRNIEMVRIIWRDVLEYADLWETTSRLSCLAELSLQAGLDFCEQELTTVLGRPTDANGHAARFTVLALGKLGAGELNLSSDIDLMFVFTAHGNTQGGRRSVENQHYFNQLGQKLIHVINKITADGFVFRVDMRLRPFGQSGPLAQAFISMETYYQSHGRDWERYALIKGRPVAGDLDAGYQLMDSLNSFIYRRYIDYSAFESLREMKSLISHQVKQKGQENNVKIGVGGIREIEFIAQAFQLIRGGQDRRFQVPKLRVVYQVIALDSLLPDKVVGELLEAYLFLRKVEHRLQAHQDRQTHTLPEDNKAMERLYLSLGFESQEEFLTTLASTRERVHEHFAGVVAPVGEEVKTEEDPFYLWWIGQLSTDEIQVLLTPDADLDAINAVIEAFQQSRAMRSAQTVALKRLDQLMPVLLKEIATYPNTIRVMERVFSVVTAIVRRSAYISLLNERSAVLTRLVKLCDASPWISEQLASHPILLDELLDAACMLSPPPRDDLASELDDQLARAPEHDLEEMLSIWRNFKRGHSLRVAAADTSGALELMKVSDYLSYMAEVILRTVQLWVWTQLTQQYGFPTCLDSSPVGGAESSRRRPEFLIIAYGKLGGYELSYGSDLDLVFLHNVDPGGKTDGEKSIDNMLFYTKAVQKITHILTARTISGTLYEVDLRLRPSGGSGLLVASLNNFERYQEERAWTWEHQALVRARAVAGPQEMMDQFECTRSNILGIKRDLATLRKEVVQMRTKMRDHLVKPLQEGQFDLKQGYGGLVDIEFIVQYGVLAWTHQYPQLIEYTDNMTLLDQLKALQLLPVADVEILQAAYLAYRSHIHELALQNTKMVVGINAVSDHASRVNQVWERLFNG